MKQIRHHLKKIYHHHGLFALLLGFVPLTPGIIEFHALAYLKTLRHTLGNIDNLDHTIRVIFGTRGLRMYTWYQNRHIKPITAKEILATLSQANYPQAIKLTAQLFFDPRQRSYPHADHTRARLFEKLPPLLKKMVQENKRQLCSRLIALAVNQTIIDRALPSQRAFVSVAGHLLSENQRQKTNHTIRSLERTLALSEASIKSQLAGKTASYTLPPLSQATNKRRDHLLLTDHDETNLLQALELLSKSNAPEIAIAARKTLNLLRTNKN